MLLLALVLLQANPSVMSPPPIEATVVADCAADGEALKEQAAIAEARGDVPRLVELRSRRAAMLEQCAATYDGKNDQYAAWIRHWSAMEYLEAADFLRTHRGEPAQIIGLYKRSSALLTREIQEWRRAITDAQHGVKPPNCLNCSDGPIDSAAQQAQLAVAEEQLRENNDFVEQLWQGH